MTAITDFPSFLNAAAAQHEPQRLLFVFAHTVLPDDHDTQEAERYRAGQGGALMPVMCVDKDPAELTTFDDLVSESQQMGEEWGIVLVGAISGRNGQPPTAEQVEETLSLLIKTVHAGGDLSHLLAFDRHGEPLVFAEG